MPSALDGKQDVMDTLTGENDLPQWLVSSPPAAFPSSKEQIISDLLAAEDKQLLAELIQLRQQQG